MEVYKNVNTGNWITVKDYNALIEREAKEIWDNNDNEEQENYATYEDFFKVHIYNQVDRDFELIEVNWLEYILFEQKMSQYEFANKCGLERSTINRIINKNTPIEQMYLSTANAIAKGLGLSLVSFIEQYYKEEK